MMRQGGFAQSLRLIPLMAYHSFMIKFPPEENASLKIKTGQMLFNSGRVLMDFVQDFTDTRVSLL
jgi:hypothetical protein